MLNYMNFPEEENPALGNRGIRILLSHREIFKEHIRAVLRAGYYGRLRLNFPMVTNLDELLLVKELLAEVEDELHKKNIRHSNDYRVGIMLEVPAAVLGLKRLIEHVDFVSIGTNDLLQYIFAADRTNAEVALIADHLNPVFLELLLNIGTIMAEHPDKELSICGEMAGIRTAVPLVLGAGITDLSMSPALIPGIRKVVGCFSVKECRAMLEQALKYNSASEVEEFMKQQFADKSLPV
jgi:phosphotransferase system enzyme I (PtsI)